MDPAVPQSRTSPWHWLWYGPLIGLVLPLVEWHTLRYALAVLATARERWDWGGLTSPSADFCWTVVIGSVILPLVGAISASASLFVAGISSAETRQRTRCAHALLILAGIAILPFLTDFLIWGSFPFTFDRDGVGHLRMIPFVPWPDWPYGSL